MRTFDTKQQFEDIKKAAVSAIETIFPVEGRLREIRLGRVWCDDTLAPDDFKGQQSAREKEQTWGAPVYAALTLVDKATGKTIDQMAKVRLFMLPKLTPRHSYIVSGNEYQVTNQLRLKSGVYTLKKQNGELKTQVNLARGKNFDLGFDEPTGQFLIQKVGGGQANIPLAPVLAHMGVSQQAMAKAWGGALQEVNKAHDPRAIAKATAAFGVRKGTLSDYFKNTQLGSEATEMVLGKAFDKVDGQMLLSASEHLLAVHQGKKEPTDRDSLAFKELHSTEDFIKERIEKNKQALAFKLKRNIDNPRRIKLSQIVNPGAFNQVIEGFFTQDDKATTPEQTNPLEMINGQYAVTVKRSGGITSDHGIRPETREIHPTHYGFLDAVATPESSLVGVNMHIPIGAVKDEKTLKTVVYDKNQKQVTLAPLEAYNSYVAFPGQGNASTQKVQYHGQVMEVPRDKVQYTTISPTALFSWSTNLIPFLASDQGNRAMMASKQLEQAIALKYREAPLVQVAAGPHGTVEQKLGSDLIVKAKADGVVKSVSKDHIVVSTADGNVTHNLYNNYSLNRKSFMNHDAVVAVGDKVKAGQMLAESNFTKGGALALGTNMRVAYVPYKGMTFEDGIVISQSAAEKLTSEHIHKKTADISQNTIRGVTAFRSFYPNAVSPGNMAKLDENGVIKVGQKVKPGDVLCTLLEARDANKAVAMVSKVLSERPKDGSIYWQMDNEGKVIDVQQTGGQVTVFVKTEEVAKIGDKITGRHGNKGVVSKILPDAEVPHDKSGKPVDIMLNPHGVISRINVGQLYEGALGKVALKKSKTHTISNFSGENYLDSTKAALAGAKVSDKEELFDPVTKKSMGMVNVGNPYVLKLSKQGTTGFSTRQAGPGSPYDSNLQPLKLGGQEDSAKSMDLLTVYSMLAHGARANLREMSSIKSNQNDEFWKALKSGQSLPAPQAPFVYNKFMGFLRGAGIDVKKEGTEMTLAPLTDAEILKQSAGAVTKPVFFRGKDMAPIKGGFYDPVTTGGFKGTSWSHLHLTEPMVNPVFAKAVSKITGLAGKYQKIVDGEMHVDPKTGELNTDGKGLTGGAAIEHILKGIDVEKNLADTLQKLKTARGAKLDDLNKKASYLQALKTNNMKPAEAYIRRVMPVLPANFRPTFTLPDGSVTSSDINYVYQNMGILNTMMKQPVMKLLAENEKAGIRKDIALNMEGVTGLTDINIKGRERKGLISEIKGGEGSSPKKGFFISKMLSKKQDLVGRGVIIPDSDLGVDEMGMPEEMAWKLFDPFVTRELAKFSKTPLQAKEEIKERSNLARSALENVMRDRHVLLNRAPSLHKFSVMAFKPKITDGRSLKIPHLVCKGFGADFDGDQMNVHVPVTDAANEEAAKLKPSMNLFKPGSGDLMLQPTQESQLGIFYLSQTDQGRKKLSSLLPTRYAVSHVLDKKGASDLFMRMAKEMPASDFAKAIAAVKAAGENHAYESGFTLGVSDLVSVAHARDIVVKDALAKVNRLKTNGVLRPGTEAQMATIAGNATKLIDMTIDKKLAGKGNPLYDMVQSGARGNKTQLRSILASPLFVTDAAGKTIGTPIRKSYAEGLDVSDYMVSMFGARKGAMDRSLQTSLPGAFSKDVMATVIDNVVSAVDCGTHEGITEAIDSPDALDRYTSEEQLGVPYNTLVTHQVQQQLKARGAKIIKVRSVLHCHRPKGVCAKCHGLNEHGRLPDVGDNVGAVAGQAIAEPLVQLIMSTRHTGGVAGGSKQTAQGYARIDQLLKMPQIVAGAATLAPVTGKVTKIEKGVGGGFHVHMGTASAFVPSGVDLKVRVGSRLEAGDRLSDGVIKPQDLVALKGMHPAQSYIVSELKSAYASQGVTMPKRIFETVVHALSNTTKILSNSKDASYLPGDVARYTVIQDINRNLKEERDTRDCTGCALAGAQGGYEAGHVLTHQDIEKLVRDGITKVVIKREAIKHAPFLIGVQNLPGLKRDWMGSLGYRAIEKTLTEGAARNYKTETSGYHPIPALVHGATFGLGNHGKY